MQNKLFFMFLCLFVFCLNALLIAQDFPQDGGGEVEIEQQTTGEDRLSLAISSGDYPVTPGDVYRLTYTKVGENIEMEIYVESDYSLNLNVFGKIDGRGKTFPEIKNIVEETILRAYPRSMPLMSIASVGIFRVLVRGEVRQARHVLTWGFSRLSDVVRNMLGPYSSTRDVGVRSADGRLRTYDLFRAELLGETENDPIIRPGDTVIIHKRDKLIQLRGEVFRTGMYQLRADESFSYLIQNYARGFTQQADLGRIKIERTFPDSVRFMYFDLEKEGKDPDLRDGDIITIPSKLENKPVIYIEGAVTQTDTMEPGEENQEEYNYRSYSFVSGETVYDILRKIENTILPSAKMRHSYLMHTNEKGESETFPLDIEQILYNRASSRDIPVAPFDKIIIPVKQMHVAIQGDIRSPGNYRALPGQNYIYYLNIAGGPVNGTYLDNIITIINSEGEFKSTDKPIDNGDKIIVTQAYINVFGAVSTPGQYPFSYGKTVTYYLGLAGGTISGTYTEETVTVSDKEGKSKNPGEVIEFGDMIIVSQTYVNVFGAVSNPGQYPFSHDKPLAYYLGLAGGTLSGTYSQDNVEITSHEGVYKEITAPLEYGDMIVVSEIQVNVSGAVFMPGRYPFKEGKSAAYYVSLAGGIDKEQNSNGEVIIYDVAGKKKKANEYIELEDSIYVPSNTFLHNFNNSLPLITTALTVINTTITIIGLFNSGQ